ncbi:MAG: arginyl-tRNA--protein-N-Asp/Glu arginylyltransferase [Sulfurimonas sp.]|jgi:arginyl-tRNA--protein-N-Asp/Glu arginylyltransferase|uniref:arginyltransferase n=1 Tax=Sulfurimonas sp. TaxID=2022749 RepID=UPI0039E6571E
MNLLKEFSLNDKCSYLDNKEQTTHYKIINNCSAETTQELVERGYRRFGKMYFRPICADCHECQSIKIDVVNYSFSKSEKRVIKKANNLNIYMQTPSLTQEHLNLFDKYHRFMQEKKDWNFQNVTADHYYNSFVTGHAEYGKEVLYFHEEKLIGVDLIDILEDGISSIYFYYDPSYSHLSLGKLSLLQQIQYAKEVNKKWIYLGYYVQDCPSLSYKANYKPYTTLQGRPSLEDEYIWT